MNSFFPFLVTLLFLFPFTKEVCTPGDFCQGSGTICCEEYPNSLYLVQISCIENIVQQSPPPVQCGAGTGQYGCNVDDGDCYEQCELGRLLNMDQCCNSTFKMRGNGSPRRLVSFEYCPYGCVNLGDGTTCYKDPCLIGASCLVNGAFCCDENNTAVCTDGNVVSVTNCEYGCIGEACYNPVGCEDSTDCSSFNSSDFCCNDDTTAYCTSGGDIQIGSQNSCSFGCNLNSGICYEECELGSNCLINGEKCCVNGTRTYTVDCNGLVVTDVNNNDCQFGCYGVFGCLSRCQVGAVCPSLFVDEFYCCLEQNNWLRKCDDDGTLMPSQKGFLCIEQYGYAGCKRDVDNAPNRCYDLYEIGSKCTSTRCNGDTLVVCATNNGTVMQHQNCPYGCDTDHCLGVCHMDASCTTPGYFCCDGTTKALCTSLLKIYDTEPCSENCISDTCYVSNGCENGISCSSDPPTIGWFCCNDDMIGFCLSPSEIIQSSTQIPCENGCATDDCFSNCAENSKCSINGKICCDNGDDADCDGNKVTSLTSTPCPYGCKINEGCLDECVLDSNCDSGYDNGLFCCNTTGTEIHICQSGKVHQIETCIYGCKSQTQPYDRCYLENEEGSFCTLSANTYCFGDNLITCNTVSNRVISNQVCANGCNLTSCYDDDTFDDTSDDDTDDDTSDDDTNDDTTDDTSDDTFDDTDDTDDGSVLDSSVIIGSVLGGVIFLLVIFLIICSVIVFVLLFLFRKKKKSEKIDVELVDEKSSDDDAKKEEEKDKSDKKEIEKDKGDKKSETESSDDGKSSDDSKESSDDSKESSDSDE